MSNFLDSLKIFFRKRVVFWSLIVALVLNSYLWYLIRNFIDFNRDFHILHYNAYFGIDYIAPAQQFIYLPFLALGIYLINLLFAFIYYHYSKGSWIFSYIFLAVGIFINIELIIYLIKIIGIEY
ncbi:hypothetical protein K8R66_00755 [bacterium]|nr:hypothetical protein [bacterium]